MTAAALPFSLATLGGRYHIFVARLASIFRAGATRNCCFAASGLRHSCSDSLFFASTVWKSPPVVATVHSSFIANPQRRDQDQGGTYETPPHCVHSPRDGDGGSDLHHDVHGSDTCPRAGADPAARLGSIRDTTPGRRNSPEEPSKSAAPRRKRCRCIAAAGRCRSSPSRREIGQARTPPSKKGRAGRPAPLASGSASGLRRPA